ncbi:MAG TPA: hypothetical protein VMV44_14510 [Rectinemataceae bacterium]|nr:hypothetical protein [Rectinemataceae bacterium]
MKDSVKDELSQSSQLSFDEINRDFLAITAGLAPQSRAVGGLYSGGSFRTRPGSAVLSDAARERSLSLARLAQREGLAIRKGAGPARLPGGREVAAPMPATYGRQRALFQWVKQNRLQLGAPLTVATYCAAYPSKGSKSFHALKSSPIWKRRMLQGIAYRKTGTVEGNEYFMSERRGKIELHADMVMTKGSKSYAHDRGEIKAWSMDSRKRFFDALLAVDWESIKSARLFVTLTYPNLFPHDGKVCKAHVDAWLKRVERKIGKVGFVWKREFQSRGAPHYHGIMVGDVAAWIERHESSLKLVKSWMRDEFFSTGGGLAAFGEELRRLWYEVVGSEDTLHAEHGVDVQVQRDPQRHAKYLAFYMTKGDQDKIPSRWHDVQNDKWYETGFTNPGRWWGFWRGEMLPRNVKVYQISAAQFVLGREAIAQVLHDGGFSRIMKDDEGNEMPLPLPDLRVSYIEFDDDKRAKVRDFILGEK